jgi:Cyclin D1 binding domain
MSTLTDKYIESQLLLISPNRLAQYWVGFGHISFFERVDIDRFLVPSADDQKASEAQRSGQSMKR